ncbi:MAG: phage integrase SAM-like domain-containing protein [Flavobacteriaceae bacterium]|nr:phage integrase SAM-like domain-containing protein [Flavobacteriaceae bacterium]
MATIQLTLKSRARKDGKYPVIIRIRHNREYFDIPTNTSIPKSKFDKKKGRVIGDKETQLFLDELMELHGRKVRTYSFQNLSREFTLKELKDFVLNKPANEILVIDFWKDTIKQLHKSGRGGSARTYKNTLSVLQKIIDLERPFSAITIKDLLLIEEVLRQRGNNYNSIAVYMRVLRAICNKAINQNIVGFDWYPFRKYKIRREKTIPKVLTLEDMKSYFQAEIDQSDPLFKAWNIGKLLFLLRGINLRDLIFLTRENIKNGRIIYRRGKTGKVYSIKYSKLIEEAFSYFSHNRKSILGIVTDELLNNPSKSLESRAQITKRINTKLKKLGEKFGFEVPLTTYVFRYTYANVARKLGYSKDLIAEALGHEYGNKVTGIYLELFDQETLDRMAEQIENTVSNLSS